MRMLVIVAVWQKLHKKVSSFSITGNKNISSALLFHWLTFCNFARFSCCCFFSVRMNYSDLFHLLRQQEEESRLDGIKKRSENIESAFQGAVFGIH